MSIFLRLCAVDTISFCTYRRDVYCCPLTPAKLRIFVSSRQCAIYALRVATQHTYDYMPYLPLQPQSATTILVMNTKGMKYKRGKRVIVTQAIQILIFSRTASRDAAIHGIIEDGGKV